MKHLSDAAIHPLKTLLDEQLLRYNQQSFIADDPISVPHRFNLKQDKEIAGFFAAIFAWGQRRTIIHKTNALMTIMDNAPYDFILHHRAKDLKCLMGFIHRTFNDTDLLYFVERLKNHYEEFESLEEAFCLNQREGMYERLKHFHQYFFAIDYPERTKKHIATPERNSACKRLNMYLRWMVRSDDAGVDFGLWKRIRMNELIIPLDTHTLFVANHLHLVQDKKANWQSAEAVTALFRSWCPEDPVKYDYALFGLGLNRNTWL